MITYEEVKKELFSHEDEKYRAFHGKLLKNPSIQLIGVRMPILRKLAKGWKGEAEAFLTFPDEYYEVTFLKCALVGMLPFGEFCKAVDEVVPLIDNWATCDCFDASCIKKHREEFLPYVERYLSDKREFVARYGLVTLLHYYVEEQYLPLIFKSAERANAEQYYVMMAAAWLIAEVIVKFYDRGLAYLKEGKLPAAIHNKAIQKARESFRLDKEQKQQLNALKR
ncbi:MAG: DNA alkylation repair protein [Clostridiales bacterium]|nr:DNA alkylation repair protein [Clostridiales bacterium]